MIWFPQEKKNSVSDTDTKKVTVQIDGRKKKTGGTASKKSKEITTHLVSIWYYNHNVKVVLYILKSQ